MMVQIMFIDLHQCLCHFGRTCGDADAALFQDRHFFGSGALAAGDDRAGMTHAFAGRGGAPVDVCRHRFGHMLLLFLVEIA